MDAKRAILAGPAGQRIYGGTFTPAAGSGLAGSVAAADAVASGVLTSSPPPPPPAPAAPPGTLPSVRVTSPTVATLPWAVGHAFADGDLTASQALATHQLTVISTWPSGCVRLAIVSGVTALSSGSNAITLTRGTAPGGSAITTAALQAAMTQPVTVGVSGIGSASWSGADWLAPFATWASGPIMSSWVYRKPVGSDAHLVAWLEVRMWSNGAVEVLPWVENGYLFVASGRTVGGTYTFTMGGTVRFSDDIGYERVTPAYTGTTFETPLRMESGGVGTTSRVRSSALYGTATYQSYNSSTERFVYGVTWDTSAPVTMTSLIVLGLPHHCRTPLVNGTKLAHWLAADPGLVITHDAGYMMRTEMVPTYGATVAADGHPITRLPATYTPLQQGGYASVMGTAGASEDIGILPDWDAAYLAGAASSAWAGLQRNAYSAGRFGIYFRDEATNRPIRFSQHPTLLVSSGAIGSSSQSTTENYAIQGPGTLPTLWQNSHHPSIGYMAALITGRFFHVETCQFAGAIPYLINGDDADRRDGSKGLIRSYWGANMTRGAAWGLRSLVNALAITPDSDPLKAEFQSSWSSNLNYYHTRYVAGSHNPQGWVTPYSNQNAPGSPYMAQPWMDDFFTSVIGYARCLQVTTATGDEAKLTAFFNWKAQSIVGRTGLAAEADYLYRDMGMYFGAFAPSNSTDWHGGTGPWYNTWGEVYAGTVSYWGNNVAPAFIGDKQIGDGSLRNHNGISSNSYFANAIPALAYAARWGVSGAVEGYNRIVSAPNWATYATDSAGWPVFNIKPSSPPYALPSLGTAKLIAVSGAHEEANPGIHSANEFRYSVFGSFGSGTFNPHWSPRGAYMLAGTGGHGHPETFGCVYFDFQTGKWGYIPAVGQVDRSVVNEVTETNGPPWYEMTGTQIPAPPHPYSSQVVLPPSLGGAARGSLAYVTRFAVGSGARGAHTAHRFDLPGGVWSRAAATEAPAGGGPIFDPVTNRYWIVGGDLWSVNKLYYWQLPGTTWHEITGVGFSYATGDSNLGSNAFLYGRLIVVHQGTPSNAAGRFQAIDVDNPTLGWSILDVAGPALDVNYANGWVFHPQKGAFYRRYADRAGPETLYPQGQVIYKLTPPASSPRTNQWVITSQSLTGDVMPEFSGSLVGTQAFNSLVYVPALRMLAWMTAFGVSLINPA